MMDPGRPLRDSVGMMGDNEHHPDELTELPDNAESTRE